MKAADQVLAGGKVHSGLAADRGVDLSQQRGRDLDHRDTAHENGGEKACHVREDAATECNDDAGPVAAPAGNLLGEGLYVGETLARFAAGEIEEIVWAALHAAIQRGAVVPPNVLGRDHKDLAGLRRDKAAGLVENAALHLGMVGALRRL